MILSEVKATTWKKEKKVEISLTLKILSTYAKPVSIKLDFSPKEADELASKILQVLRSDLGWA